MTTTGTFLPQPSGSMAVSCVLLVAMSGAVHGPTVTVGRPCETEPLILVKPKFAPEMVRMVPPTVAPPWLPVPWLKTAVTEGSR